MTLRRYNELAALVGRLWEVRWHAIRLGQRGYASRAAGVITSVEYRLSDAACYGLGDR